MGFLKALLMVVMIAGNTLVAAQYRAVTNEERFKEIVVGRALSWPGGFNVQFTSDGRIVGNFPSGEVRGNWQWQNGLFCRRISIAGQSRRSECLGIEIELNRVRFRRDNGNYFLPYFIGDAIE